MWLKIKFIKKSIIETIRRSAEANTIDGSLLIIAWILDIDRYKGDSKNILEILGSRGKNKPELNAINKKRTTLTMERENLFIINIPTEIPTTDTKDIIGSI